MAVPMNAVIIYECWKDGVRAKAYLDRVAARLQRIVEGAGPSRRGDYGFVRAAVFREKS